MCVVKHTLYTTQIVPGLSTFYTLCKVNLFLSSLLYIQKHFWMLFCMIKQFCLLSLFLIYYFFNVCEDFQLLNTIKTLTSKTGSNIRNSFDGLVFLATNRSVFSVQIGFIHIFPTRFSLELILFFSFFGLIMSFLKGAYKPSGLQTAWERARALWHLSCGPWWTE